MVPHAAMSRRQAELIAIGETGLKLVILPTQYQQGGVRMQMAYMLFWWSNIIELVEQGDGGHRWHAVGLSFEIEFAENILHHRHF